MVEYELNFKRVPGKVDISASKTKKAVDKEIKQLRKFGYKKGKSVTSLKTGQYYVNKYK